MTNQGDKGSGAFAAMFFLVASLGLCGANASEIPASRFDGKLSDLIPSLYGGDGVTLASDSVFSHSAHFTDASLVQFNELSLSLRDLSFPVLNPQAGITFRYDPVLDEFVRAGETLGASAFAFDAQTVGRGIFQIGLAYSSRQFSKLDGTSLSDITIDLHHMDLGDNGSDLPCIGGPEGACYAFEKDVVRLTVDLDIKEEMYALTGGYGITDNLDVGLFLPLLRTSMEASSTASIIEDASSAFFPVTLHRFDELSDIPADALQATKTGIGDTVLRLNYSLPGENDGWQLLMGVDVRFPTGDVDNLQGLPRVGLRPRIAVSRDLELWGGKLRPHLNAAYGVNAGQMNEHIFDYAVGGTYTLDWSAGLRAIAFSADVLGRHVTRNKDGRGDNQYDAAFGVMLRAVKDFNFYYNIRVPINNAGLRPSAQHVFGVQVRF